MPSDMGRMLGPMLNRSADMMKRIMSGNPNTTMVNITALGKQKAENYGVDGKAGMILNHLNGTGMTSVADLARYTNTELHTVRVVVKDLSQSELITVGGNR